MNNGTNASDNYEPLADAFSYRLLGTGQQWGYYTFTFPALRYLLDRLDGDEVFAIGAEDTVGAPVGLALGRVAASKTEFRQAELMSIYVIPGMRRRGVGTHLLDTFTVHCRVLGLARIRITYMTGQASTPALEAILARAGWTPPETRMLVVQATLDSIRHAPWIRVLPLPKGTQIVPWVDLTASDRATLAESQNTQPWIPHDLYPFNHEAGCEPTTSLALKEDGHVVGWVINHRVGRVLRYTCAFMHPRRQRKCRILLLYNEAVSRMPQAGFDTGIWTVPTWHPDHAAFARRWMVPYAIQFNETRGSALLLLR
ncbi:N-acetyltransferase domain-containing protein [Gammaproteobacteria bacterium]